jgi:YVTN family beta-propeller protein
MDPACNIDASAAASGGCRLVAEVPVGLDPEGVVVDGATDLAYVACSRSDAVTVVDLGSCTVVATIPVGPEPIDIAFDRRRRRAFTADARANQVSVIDVDTRAVVATVAVGAYPAGLGIDVEGRRLFCGDTMGSTLSVIDLDSLELLGQVPAELGAGAVAGDGKRVYCANFMAASVTVIDPGTLRAVDRLEVGDGPCAVAVNEALGEVYVVNSLGGTVSRFALAGGAPLGELVVSAAPVGVAVAAAGDRLYVANRGDGTLTVIDPEGNEWARVPVGAAPGGVAVHPDDPRRVLVTNAGSASLSVVEDGLSGRPAAALLSADHPMVGQRLPAFSLPDARSDGLRHSVEWAEKKYILNFFASW